MSAKKVILYFLFPVILSFLLHWNIFNLDVSGMHVWRQSQTQTVVYNFVHEDNNILHPLRFDLHDGTREVLYEFPLYQYSVALTDRAFGYSVFHSRILSFICFIFFLIGFYLLQREFYPTTHALKINALLCFSPLLYYYCAVPMPDIMALGFSVWFLYFLISFSNNFRLLFFFLACISLALATLVKLQYILFAVTMIPVFWLKWKQFSRSQLFVCIELFLSSLIFPALWYYRAIPTWDSNGIVRGIFDSQISVLTWFDALLFTLISSFPELLANYGSLFFLLAGAYYFFRDKKWKEKKNTAFVWLTIVLVLYLLFELNMIGRTHDYYLMPFIVPVFMVISFGLDKFQSVHKNKLVWLVMLAVPVFAYFRMQHRWDESEAQFDLAFRDESKMIQELIPADSLCIVDSDESRYIALYHFRRKGFSLQPNELNEKKLQELRRKGARYLITNSSDFNDAQFPAFSLKKLWQNKLTVYYVQ